MTSFKIGDTFIIRLASNITTGYDWFIVDFEKNKKYLEFIEKSHLSSEENRLGASGYTIFLFKALKKVNDLEINFSYKRPWENSSLTNKSFRISVV
jgi:inhibitor of cysteine peptidase